MARTCRQCNHCMGICSQNIPFCGSLIFAQWWHLCTFLRRADVLLFTDSPWPTKPTMISTQIAFDLPKYLIFMIKGLAAQTICHSSRNAHMSDLVGLVLVLTPWQQLKELSCEDGELQWNSGQLLFKKAWCTGILTNKAGKLGAISCCVPVML